MPRRSAKHLTESIVEAAIAGEKPYEMLDAGQPGLLLRVQPSGAKSWNISYTIDGRKTRKSIGKHPQMSVKAARTKAKKPLGIAQEGRDPYSNEKKSRSALLGKYLDGLYKEYAQAHILSHADILPRLKRNWGHLAKRSMADINDLDVQRWRKRKMAEDNPVAFETLQRELTYLKAMLSTAVAEHKLIPAHQLKGYTLKRDTQQLANDERRKPRYLSDVEERALRAALGARDDDLRAARERMRQWQRSRGQELSPKIPPDAYPDHITPIVLVALNTGLRQGDIFSLKWQHLDLDGGKLRKVINKTRRKNPGMTPAELPLSGEAVNVLRRWHKQGKQNKLVFPSPITGGELDNIRKAWCAILKAADIADFRFHDLRHTFASRLVMAGVDINTVRELMTHSKIEMTLVYSHLSPDHKAAAISKAFGGGL